MKRISIAVHGRFHAFDLAAALLWQGINVQLLTNYPRSVVRQWFPSERTKSLLLHGLLTRVSGKFGNTEPPEFLEAAGKRYFGRWAARKHARAQPDAAHCWSGVAEETLQARPAAICSMTRGSAHIAVQKELLAEEQTRVGVPLDQPSQWIVKREEREYALADRIIVPTVFARDSFAAHIADAAKVKVVPLAWRMPGFSARPDIIEKRVQRLRSGGPSRVLYTGTLSYRKGMHDLLDVMRALSGKMQFRLVGPLLPECSSFARAAARHAHVDPPVPQQDLPDVYAWGDIFLMPTIEDGFAVVLAQAQAAGLPILTTANSGGPDIIAGGGQGWIVPIRAPEAIIARLTWCNDNREQLSRMVEALHAQPPQRDWNHVATDFVQALTC